MHTFDPGTWVWMAVWLLALFAMVWLLISPPRRARPESPADILRRRYAAGEITDEEFRHALDVLGTGG